MSTASGRQPSHLDDDASAVVLCEAERTRRPPDKDVRGQLDHEWSEGVLAAEGGGLAGTERWLKTLYLTRP